MKFCPLFSVFAAVAALGLCATGAARAQNAASPSPSPAAAAAPAKTEPAPDAKPIEMTPPKDRAVDPVILEKYDLNHNGVLDPDERKAYQKDAPQRRAERLKKYDVNHDGKIDADEQIMVRLDRMRENEAAKKRLATASAMASPAQATGADAKKP